MRNQYVDRKTGAVCLLSNFNGGKRIDRIYVPPEYRGCGHGRLMLRAVLTVADREGVTLWLIIVADKYSSLNDSELESWYASNDFVREPDSDIYFKRLPQCVSIQTLPSRQKKTAAIGSNAIPAHSKGLAKILSRWLLWHLD